MITRNSEIKRFEKALDDIDISVLNIYGEAGIGKSVFVQQLMNDKTLSGKMAGGYIDLGIFNTSSDSEMIDELYELCNQLKAEKKSLESEVQKICYRLSNGIYQ